MIPLPESFKHGGFNFTLLNRDGRVALFAKSKPGMSVRYEVVLVESRPAELVGGKDYPPREAMPKTSSWGRLGWSYGRNEKDRAEMKFLELIEKAESALQGASGSHPVGSSMYRSRKRGKNASFRHSERENESNS
jgi:hypothetical protein